MKKKKYFVGLIVILIIFSIMKFNTIARDYERVDSFRGANLQNKLFDPLIAESINSRLLTATIEGDTYTNKEDGIYMDDDLQLVVPLSIVQRSLNCSAHIYANQLLVERNNMQLLAAIDDNSILVNGKEISVKETYFEKDGIYYLPIQLLADYVEFAYSWDMDNNAASVYNISEQPSYLPSDFDLREEHRAATVRDQGNLGTCWAFASLSALESAIRPGLDYVFSPDHMSIHNNFSTDQNYGGEYTMSTAYLTSWSGPVLEEVDPYGDDESPDNLAPILHVQEVQILEAKDLEKIKEKIYKYGAVQTSIYNDLAVNPGWSKWYNRDTSSYCYQGEKNSNHDIVIIGWDDSYSADNFNYKPEGNGAFICQNSWGTVFGKDGIFYVSYYDTNIGMHSVSYTKTESIDNYDRIYQSDLCGWVGQLGYSKSDLYATNVYTAQSDETVEAVGFYATAPGTTYRVYIEPEFTSIEDINIGEVCAQGTFKSTGYYTVDLSKEIEIEEGQKYAVTLYINSPDASRPIAVEYAADDTTKDVDLTDGESYISSRGVDWESVEEKYECNICLKVYTDLQEDLIKNRTIKQ